MAYSDKELKLQLKTYQRNRPTIQKVTVLKFRLTFKMEVKTIN